MPISFFSGNGNAATESSTSEIIGHGHTEPAAAQSSNDDTSSRQLESVEPAADDRNQTGSGSQTPSSSITQISDPCTVSAMPEESTRAEVEDDSKTCKNAYQYVWAKFASTQRGGSDRRRTVSCTVCIKYPEIVKLHCGFRTPAICTSSGAVFRQVLMTEHDASDWHKACMAKARQQKAAAAGDIAAAETSLERSFRFANSELEKKIAKMIIQVYNDAKRGTLSAWSFPSRWVASVVGERLELNDKHVQFAPTKSDLQYINPYWHHELLMTIAEADRKTFSTRLSNIIALSLRVDGAVDKQQIDNKHVMAKYITTSGEPKTVYLGFSQSEETGSSGLFGAVKEAVSKCGVPWEDVFCKVTSIVTDGESANTGHRHSLWTHLSNERCNGDTPALPLVKIWCAVHRSQLAYKDMATTVPEISHLITDCKAVATYYRVSAVRMKGIKEAAKQNNMDVCQFPSVKDIRFTQYSYALLSSTLKNYNPMITHLQGESGAEAAGFLSKWQDRDTVKLTAILCDVLFLYKRFQKLIQSDSMTVFDVDISRQHCVTEIEKLLDRCLPGGYEEKLIANNSGGEDNKVTFAGIELHETLRRPKRRNHLFVTTRDRDVNAIKVCQSKAKQRCVMGVGSASMPSLCKRKIQQCRLSQCTTGRYSRICHTLCLYNCVSLLANSKHGS